MESFRPHDRGHTVRSNFSKVAGRVVSLTIQRDEPIGIQVRSFEVTSRHTCPPMSSSLHRFSALRSRLQAYAELDAVHRITNRAGVHPIQRQIGQVDGADIMRFTDAVGVEQAGV